jgi:hypothetical protein
MDNVRNRDIIMLLKLLNEGDRAMAGHVTGMGKRKINTKFVP